MAEGAVDRVRAALVAGGAPTRKDFEHALREVFPGLSQRRVRKIASEGFKAFHESAEDALLSQAAELLKSMESR